MAEYVYLGDRFTRPELKGAVCDAVPGGVCAWPGERAGETAEEVGPWRVKSNLN